MKDWKNIYRKPNYRWPLLFFVAYLLLGSLIFGDYGMSWDEPIQRSHGLVSARYVNEVFPYSERDFTWHKLEEYYHRYYGVFFTLPMVWLEDAMGLETDRQIYRLRHAGSFFLFWLGSVFFYRILLRRFEDWRWALLGAAILLLSPRTFGHSFFNPKDIPFMGLFMISSWSLYRFWLKPTAANGLLHGITCGALISMRVLGVLMPAMTLFLFLADPLLGRREVWAKWWKQALALLFFGAVLSGATVLFWPFLWENPALRLQEAFGAMSKYGWTGKMLFRGEYIPGKDVPWYYIPWWIGISVPLLYLLLGLAGLWSVLRSGWKNLAVPPRCVWRSAGERMDWANTGLFIAPILAIIVLKSTVYDGWRHLYFIYPSLVFLAVRGVHGLWRLAESRNPQLQRAMLLVLGLNFAWIAVWMVRNHPYQQVYFNVLAAGNQLGYYDLDYWGTSYGEGLKAILRQDGRELIKVAYNKSPAQHNYHYLRGADRWRIKLVESLEDADYYITAYRYYKKEMEKVKNREGVYGREEVYSIQVGGSKIMSVFRLR